MKSLSFADLIDISSLQLIQDSFSEYTGLALTVIDTEGRPVTNYSGDFRAEEIDLEVPIVFDGRTVGNIMVRKAPGMSGEQIEKAAHFLSEYSKALSILAYSNYKKIQKSQKLEKAARSQASYIVSLTEEMRVNMKEWIDLFKTTTDKYKDMPEVRQETDMILAKGQEVYAVIDGVVDYIHLSGGNVEYSESVYDVKNLLEEIKDSVRKEAAEAAVTIKTYYDPSAPETLMGNSGRIGQTVSKLVGALLKLTKKGGEIELSVSCEKSPYACILCIKTLCDSCCMDEKTKKRIHKAIKKGVSDSYIEDNAKNDEMKLSMILFLVNQMHGNMVFEDLGDDKVVFTLEIPQLDGEKVSA